MAAVSSLSSGRLEAEILEKMANSIVAVDAELRVLFCNSTAERTFGLSLNDCEIGALEMRLGPIDDALRQALDRVLAGGPTETVEHGLESGDARFSTVVYAVAEGVCFVARPMVRKRAVDDTECVHRLRDCLAAANIGTWRVDLRAGLDTRDRTLNGIFGLPPIETVTRVEDFIERVLPEDRSKVVGAIDRALAERSGYDLTFRVVRNDGSMRWVRDVGRVICDDEGPAAMTGALIDVTTATASEQTVRASELRYRSLVLATHHLVWTTDAAGQMRDAQPLWCAYTGQRLERALDHGWMDAVHPEDRAAFQSSWSFALERHRVHVAEFRLRRHDDTYRHVQMRAAPVRDEGGAVVEWIATAVDQTDGLRTEAQLAAVFDAAPMGIAVVDRELGLVHTNRKMTELDGVSFERHHRRVLETGEPITGMELAIESRTEVGTPRHWLLGFYPVLVDGETTGTVAIALEITSRKRVEQSFAQLARTSQALASSLDLATTLRNAAASFVPVQADLAAVFLCDEMGRFTLATSIHADASRTETTEQALATARIDASPALAQLARFGSTIRYEVLGDDDLRALSGASTPSALAALGLCSAVALPLVAQGRVNGAALLARQATRRPYSAHELPLAEETARRAAVAIENARLFELSRHEQIRVEEANRAKDEFLAVVSHELRTPLNAMLGWSKMLLSGVLEPTQGRRALEAIERNARAQAQLVEDLLDISRVITGKLRIKLEPVDIASVLDAAIEVVRPAAAAKGVTIETIFGAEDAPLLGDADRLQQILWNLVSNAVKFTPQGGRVDVTLGRSREGCTVTVADTGQGVAPEFLPHMFDRFRQEGGGTTRKHGGLGLGLAIARHLAELHGGTIEAFSDGPGRGARFVMKLPVAPKHVPLDLPFSRTDVTETATKPAARPSARGIRVLIVDDEPDARELMESILRNAGALVRSASSVREALAEMRRDPVDVIVSDIAMPGEDGYALIRQVRALAPESGGSTPVIALTAYARAEDRKKALTAGFTMHMSKPVEPSILLAALETLAPASRAVS